MTDETSSKTISVDEALEKNEYKYGFTTDIETDTLPKGLSEDVVRAISLKKKEPQFMLDFRLKAYRKWLTMKEPAWPNVHYPKIDFQDISYYSAPKQKIDMPKNLDEFDPELLETYKKLGMDPSDVTSLEEYMEEYFSKILRKLKEVGGESRQRDFYL